MASTLSSASLSGLGISGLSSGLDTSGIITKLMAIESQPQTQLRSTLSSATTYRTALQSLNTSVAAIGTTAKAAAKAGGLTSFTTTSSAPGVTATTTPSATAGSVSFTVDRLAASQVSVTGPLGGADLAAVPALTFRTGTGAAAKDTTVTLPSSDLDDVVDAINRSSAGVTATKVAAGTSNGSPQFRLQLSATASGAAGAFSVVAGTSTASGTAFPTTTVAAAQDAQVTLYGGTAAEQVVTSSSNTFSSLMTGVDVAVTATTTSAATVTVRPDAAAATAAAQALTSGLITLFSGIAAATAVTTTTSGSGASSSTTGSVFTGDSSVRLLKDSLLSAATDPVTGRSPSSIGISVTKDGTITFDQAAFATAMKSDAVGTTAVFQAIATRVSAVSASASDPYAGTLTQRITSQQGTESSLTKQIGDWDSRLAVIQAQYTKQFNDLETALNSLSSQASYLTSQISGLTTNYQNR